MEQAVIKMPRKVIPVDLRELGPAVMKGAAITNMSQQSFIRECVRLHAPPLIEAFKKLRSKTPRP